MEEVSSTQKSYELWPQKCDKDTTFFHKMVNANRRRKEFSGQDQKQWSMGR